jgi:hypothetical protein
MEPNRDDQLLADLQALRPTPRPQFAAELDERAAAGFPRRSRLNLSLPSLSAKRLLIPAGGLAVVAIAVITAVSLGGSESGQVDLHSSIEAAPRHSASQAGQASTEKEGGTVFAAPATTLGSEVPDASRSLHHRTVERSAEVVLAADPQDVADDAGKVFEAVHAQNGIVMRSSTQQGPAGEAGATFDLLIPSAKLDDALAAFSEIDAVRSRHEATADITAPTVSTGELLQDSKARIDSLLAQLEEAETESEREAVEAELGQERRHRAFLRSRFQHLQRRADLSRVSLRIETGSDSESSGGGAWGIDDAFHDAGHVLTITAAVTLIALAILGPIALIALLAWLTHRAWVRRERRRVLG